MRMKSEKKGRKNNRPLKALGTTNRWEKGNLLCLSVFAWGKTLHETTATFKVWCNAVQSFCFKNAFTVEKVFAQTNFERIWFLETFGSNNFELWLHDSSVSFFSLDESSRQWIFHVSLIFNLTKFYSLRPQVHAKNLLRARERCAQCPTNCSIIFLFSKFFPFVQQTCQMHSKHACVFFCLHVQDFWRVANWFANELKRKRKHCLACTKVALKPVEICWCWLSRISLQTETFSTCIAHFLKTVERTSLTS